MRVRFLVDGFVPSASIEANVRALIDQAVAEIACPAGAVTELIVTDENRFDEAVRLLAPGTPRYASDVFTEAGKTITLPSTSGRASSGIILLDHIVVDAFAALKLAPEQRSGQAQRCIYVIWHEVAHARDARLRPPTPRPDRVTDAMGEFKIRHVANYYRPIVQEEVLVCQMSAFACTQAMFDLEAREANEVMEAELRELIGELINYTGDARHLRRIAFRAAGVFWVCLVQHGKLLAYQMGNPQLTGGLTLWASSPTATQGVFQDYASLLKEMVASYPNTAADFEERLFRIWIQLALIHEYKFEESPQGDSLSW